MISQSYLNENWLENPCVSYKHVQSTPCLYGLCHQIRTSSRISNVADYVYKLACWNIFWSLLLNSFCFFVYSKVIARPIPVVPPVIQAVFPANNRHAGAISRQEIDNTSKILGLISNSGVFLLGQSKEEVD